MIEERASVILDLKKVNEALEKGGPTSHGVNRLLDEWDGLKTLVEELRVEIQGLKSVILERLEK